MCNLYSITTNQEAISRLFRKVNRYVGNLAPMPGVFPDYPAPVIRAEYGAALNYAKGWLWKHESGTYVRFTPAGAELFA
jgi:putative SOS response-associated peptidase YedK